MCFSFGHLCTVRVTYRFYFNSFYSRLFVFFIFVLWLHLILNPLHFHLLILSAWLVLYLLLGWSILGLSHWPFLVSQRLWRLRLICIAWRVWHLNFLKNLNNSKISWQLVLSEHSFQTRWFKFFNKVKQLVCNCLNILFSVAKSTLSQVSIPGVASVGYFVRRIYGHSTEEWRLML